MEYEWDPEKNRLNFEKHLIDFFELVHIQWDETVARRSDRFQEERCERSVT